MGRELKKAYYRGIFFGISITLASIVVLVYIFMAIEALAVEMSASVGENPDNKYTTCCSVDCSKYLTEKLQFDKIKTY